MRHPASMSWDPTRFNYILGIHVLYANMDWYQLSAAWSKYCLKIAAILTWHQFIKTMVTFSSSHELIHSLLHHQEQPFIPLINACKWCHWHQANVWEIVGTHSLSKRMQHKFSSDTEWIVRNMLRRSLMKCKSNSGRQQLSKWVLLKCW